MAIIKKMQVYTGNQENPWTQYLFGVEATNVSLSASLNYNNVQEAIGGLQSEINTIATKTINLNSSANQVTGILAVSNGGTGRSSSVGIKANLASSQAADALSSNIGVTGTLPVANGGTNRTSISNIRANLASSTAANALAGNIGVYGTLPVANGGTNRTSISNIRANLASSTAANALAGNIGVTGTLKVANGGTGATSGSDARKNLGGLVYQKIFNGLSKGKGQDLGTNADVLKYRFFMVTTSNSGVLLGYRSGDNTGTSNIYATGGRDNGTTTYQFNCTLSCSSKGLVKNVAASYHQLKSTGAPGTEVNVNGLYAIC